MPDDRAASLAASLAQGVRALREGRFDEAVAALGAVCDDAAFRAAADLVDIRARALSLYAEALWLSGRAEEALPRADAALIAARRAGDIEGVDQVERLRERIRGALKKAPITLGAPERRELDAIEAAYAPGPERAEVLLRRASTALLDGDAAIAVAAALRAREVTPGVPRVAVLTALVVARAAPDRASEELLAALEAARAGSDPTLVGAVLREAALAGIALENGG